MKTNFIKTLGLAVFALLLIAAAKPAEAIVITIDDFNYLGVVSPDGTQLNLLGSATFNLNLANGVGLFQGQAEDLFGSGTYNITATYAFASYISNDSSFDMSNYTDVYDALVNDPAGGLIGFDDISNMLITNTSGNPSYSLAGKKNIDGHYAYLQYLPATEEIYSAAWFMPSGGCPGGNSMGCGSDLFFTGEGPDNPSAVPEPATMALMGFGLAGMGYTKRRKKAQKA